MKILEIVRIIFITGVLLYLIFFLGRVIINGLKTGAIRHTDTKDYFLRRKSPIKFWMMTFLFIGFILVMAFAWFSTILMICSGCSTNKPIIDF